MISFDEAYQIVLQHKKDFGSEYIPLQKGIGRVLRENWSADRDLPPYNRVTMDGIAVLFNGVQKNTALKIEGVAAAGAPQMTLENNTNCLEVMTGSILPNNTDTVIRYEDLTIENGTATINVDFKQGQNIHTKGSDRQQGDPLISEFTKLSPAEIGVGASIGRAEVLVSKLPSILIISTGDELVDINQQPLAHQIRKSNVYRIESTLKAIGVKVETAHLNDDLDEIVNKLKDYINTFDVLILSGGVSKGKFDFLPEALAKVGVEKHFHKVAQRPGKPFWFGTHPDGCTVFALPGNPVSSFMCTHVYVLDWLNVSLGLPPITRPKAILTEDFTFKPDLDYFLVAKLSYADDGKLLATPKPGNGSGDLANLVDGDCFVRLTRGRNEFKCGEIFSGYIYR